MRASAAAALPQLSMPEHLKCTISTWMPQVSAMSIASSTASSTRFDSSRMWVKYPACGGARARLQSSTISSRPAYEPGAVNRPEDMPSAPASSPSSSSAIMRCISPGVGVRSSMPITMSRSVLWPTSMPALTAVAGKVSRYSRKERSRNGSHGAEGLR
jgi:hypothetical protein